MAPSRRSAACRILIGPPTKAIRVWPVSSRWDTARSPPSTSSTDTEHWPRVGDRLSTSTTGVPRRCTRASRASAPATGVIRIPCTRCSSSTSRYRDSLAFWSSVLHRITARPASLAASSTPRATSVKNGLATSSTTRPMVRLRPALSWRADSFLMNPSSLIAAWTRARVRSATTSGWFSTLETVPRDTPARAATSLILTGVFATSPPERSVSGGASAHVNLDQRE